MDEDSTNYIPHCGVVMKHLSGEFKSHQTWDWLQTTTAVWRCEHDHSSGAGPEIYVNDFTTAQTQLIHKGANHASNKSHQFNTCGLSVQIIFVISSLSSLSLLMLLKVRSFHLSPPLILSSSLIHTPTFVFPGFTHALSDTHTSIKSLKTSPLTTSLPHLSPRWCVQ